MDRGLDAVKTASKSSQELIEEIIIPPENWD